MDSTIKADHAKAVADANRELFRDRLKRELDKQASDAVHPDAHTGYEHAVLEGIGSRESRDALLKEGLQDKPASFLWKRRLNRQKVPKT